MTLIIAADAQDHLILAGDHCAVMSRVSNQGAPDTVLDNYRKVYSWKYGAIAASGDVFLMVYFHQLFLHHESRGHPIDLLRVAREAKEIRSRSGIRPSRSTGNIFFTLPGREGSDLYGLSVGTDTIDYEIIEPLSTRFSMREERVPDESACHAFNSRLRPSFFFQDADAFHRHHIDLLRAFFARQSAVDALVTSSFDVFVLEKKTGIGMFWRISKLATQLASVDLRNDEGGVASTFAMPLAWMREAR